MKIKILHFTLLLQFLGLTVYSQNHGEIIKSTSAGCIYTEIPVYIINSDHVVYQHCKSRKILRPDMASFTLLNRSWETGIAKDKNAIYYQGELITADTSGFQVYDQIPDDYIKYRWI